MPAFGKTSRTRLKTCHPLLIEICNEAIEIMDFSVICGHRSQKEQTKAFDSGHSKVQFPRSRHNVSPSRAVDIAPYRKGVQWDDKEAFCLLAGIMFGIAATKGVKLRWGGDWDGDFNVHDQTFNDLAHFELT